MSNTLILSVMVIMSPQLHTCNMAGIWSVMACLKRRKWMFVNSIWAQGTARRRLINLRVGGGRDSEGVN